jgi:inosose dehydratase
MHQNESIQSRRSLLRLGAAGIAGVALSSALPRLASAAEATDDYGGLPLGLQSYTLRAMPFKNALEAMSKDLGLHYVEVYSRHLGPTDKPSVVTMNGVNAKPEEALDLLKSYGVTAVSIGAVPISTKEPEVRSMFEFAKRLGMKNLSISPDPKAFDLLDKLCDKYNITVGIHDHGPEDKRWGKIAQIQEGIKDHNKKIGLCNDTGHFIRNGEDPLKACHVFKDRLHAMHLKDFKKDDKGKWEDCVLGEGSLDVDGIIKFLLDVKFTGALAIEYEGVTAPVEAVQKSLDRIKQAVKKAKA